MQSWIGPAVTAAVISSLIAAIGWYVSWRTAKGLEVERRKERVLDTQTALLAEIRSAVHHIQQYETSEILRAVAAQLDASETYVPFVAREPGSPLFDAIISEISILPNGVIEDVVLFYRQQVVVANFADDLRGARFETAPNDRKKAMISDYMALRDHAGTLGTAAIEGLERSIANEINRSASGRSAPR